MAKIIQMDKHVAELIAAGEVVERPASVVKELVENSVDAGATSVTVEIKHGGLELIRVSDNGGGIASDDIRTAFLRHATSKIRTAEDLAEIRTMGFRGEALASIAAVSKVQVFSRAAEATAGVCYEIEGGQEISLEEAGCPPGTTMLVRELFFNTPARMKFVKKDQTEAGQVQLVVRRAALARPDVSFKLIKDGEELLHTPGDHSLLSAIYCIFGGPYAAGFEKASLEHEGVRVTGYVSKPVYSQGTRAKQEFFVNGRPVRSRVLSAALEEAYKNRMMVNRYPACVLHIDITPAVLDVNVHPAKTEIKFAFERQVFDAVFLAAKDAVDGEDARAEIVSTARPPQFAAPPKESYVQTTVPQTGFFQSMSAETFRAQQPAARPFAASPAAAAAPAGSGDRPVREAPASGGAARMYDTLGHFRMVKPVSPADFDRAVPAADEAAHAGDSSNGSAPQTADESVSRSDSTDSGTEPQVDDLPKWKIIGEAFDSYIMVEDGSDILFIDKHAAHERILFEKLSAEGQQPLSQMLMEPLVLRFDREELDILITNRELLGDMGFEYEPFGGDSMLVRALPEEIDRTDAQASLDEIALSLIENRRAPMTQRREEALRLVACKAAVKAGSPSTAAEKYALVARVMQYADVRYCPHGRPVAAVLKKSELEKRFGRT